MKSYALFILFSLLAISCKQKKEETQKAEVQLTPDLQNYENEIMKIHDEVMGRMGEVYQLIEKLKKYETPSLETMPEGLNRSITALQKAESFMMQWMNTYSTTRDTIRLELMGPFFERELLRVTDLKTRVLNAIDDGNAWLAAYPKK